MYFWRIEELKARLTRGPMTDREVLPYAIVFGVALSLVATPYTHTPSIWDTAFGLFGAAAAIPGTIWVYRQNKGRNGTDFLQRFATIGWVTTIRLMPAGLLGVLVVSIIEGGDPDAPSTWLDAVLYACVSVAYYQRS